MGWKACKIRKVQEISPQIPISLILKTWIPHYYYNVNIKISWCIFFSLIYISLFKCCFWVRSNHAFVAETAGFEPACPKGANAFRVRLVMTTSIRLRKVWQPSAAFAERIRNLRCSSRDLRDRCSILVRRARIRSLRYSFAGFAL